MGRKTSKVMIGGKASQKAFWLISLEIWIITFVQESPCSEARDLHSHTSTCQSLYPCLRPVPNRCKSPCLQVKVTIFPCEQPTGKQSQSRPLTTAQGKAYRNTKEIQENLDRASSLLVTSVLYKRNIVYVQDNEVWSCPKI